jgi:hypothetical protein
MPVQVRHVLLLCFAPLGLDIGLVAGASSESLRRFLFYDILVCFGALDSFVAPTQK